MLGANTEHPSIAEPWIESRQIPIEWLDQHRADFVYSVDEIFDTAFAIEGVPAEAGIYFLIAEAGEYEDIVYVGQAMDIALRVTQHRINKIFDRISCIIGVPPLFLRTVESFYIYHLRPPLNIRYDPLDNIAAKWLREFTAKDGS